MKLIGLVGRKRTGKNSIAQFIRELLPSLKVGEHAFADPLKAECAAMLGVAQQEIESQKALYRGLLQWVGTEYRRGQDPNYWVDQMRLRLEAAKAAGTELAVLTDVRFVNEADLVRELGGQVWRVIGQGFPDDGDRHASETAMDEIVPDNLIYSRPGDLAHLKDRTAELLFRLGLPVKQEARQLILLGAPVGMVALQVEVPV